MNAEPGRGIFLVRARHETAERLEGAGGPLPHVADHLPTAEGAVTCGQSLHLKAAQTSPIEVRAFRRGHLIAPRVEPLAFSDPTSIRLGFSAGCHLPFG